MGRQFGSGGREIAKKLAVYLGISCYDQELITLAAKQAQFKEEIFADKDEKAASPWLYAGVYERGLSPNRSQPAEDILFQMQSEIIRKIAGREDCIIVGRCADAVLQSEDVELLRIFICAPFDWRVHHRMELNGMDEKSAVTLVRQMDKQRKRYYEYYTNHSWGKPDNYDLCVNSARLGIDRTAALLATHLRELSADKSSTQ